MPQNNDNAPAAPNSREEAVEIIEQLSEAKTSGDFASALIKAGSELVANRNDADGNGIPDGVDNLIGAAKKMIGGKLMESFTGKSQSNDDVAPAPSSGNGLMDTAKQLIGGLLDSAQKPVDTDGDGIPDQHGSGNVLLDTAKQMLGEKLKEGLLGGTPPADAGHAETIGNCQGGVGNTLIDGAKQIIGNLLGGSKPVDANHDGIPDSQQGGGNLVDQAKSMIGEAIMKEAVKGIEDRILGKH